MEREEIERWIDEAQWRSTTYLAPHEYVLYRDYPELHEALKAYLVDHGYTGRFLGREYTYTNIGAYRYWIVEGVLNRARLDTPGVFDSSTLAGGMVFKTGSPIGSSGE